MTAMKAHRWCVYIDILGFSELWETEEAKALGALRGLMQAIFRIGKYVFPSEGDRLFVHQMGDGFAIVSEFGDASLERPIAIAIALMRYVASAGAFTAAAIAEGEFADITGCYPSEVTEALEDGHVVRLGSGLMTLSSVMGTAFIRAYRLNHVLPSGPLLGMPSDYLDRIPAGLPVRATASRRGTQQLLSINWIRADLHSVHQIEQLAGLCTLTPDAVVRALKDYCARYPDLEWNHVYDLLEIEAC